MNFENQNPASFTVLNSSFFVFASTAESLITSCMFSRFAISFPSSAFVVAVETCLDLGFQGWIRGVWGICQKTYEIDDFLKVLHL